jgi:myo-inositol-1(or 4)-monophosphatase
VVDARGRPIQIHSDLTRRYSGVVAASPALADALCEAITG